MRRTVRFLATSRFLIPLAVVLGFAMLLGASALHLIPAIRSAGRVEKPSGETARAGTLSSAHLLAAKAATGATVQTDRSDYYPGENVVITGSGWQAGEVVGLALQEDPPIDTHPTLYATADD